MKKAISLMLEDEEIVELMCILLDEDIEGALAFVKNAFQRQSA